MPSTRRWLTDALWGACALCVAGSALAAGPAAVRPADRVTLPAQSDPSMITVAPARVGPASDWLESNGVVVPDARSVRDVNAYVTGQINQIFVRVGDRVKVGSALLSIYSPDFIAAQKSYLALVANEEQKKILKEEGRLGDYMKDARDNLKWWGLTDAQLDALERKSQVTEQLVLKSDTEGIVTELLVVPGALINAGDKTMKAFIVTGRVVARMVATRDPYRIEGYVFPDQLALLRVGAPVKVSGPGAKPIERTVSEIVPEVDPVTQQARFRVNLAPGSAWAPGTALRLSVQLPTASGTWIPRQAVLSQQLAPVVYVRVAPRQFERRQVSVLSETDADLQVSGVQAKEAVVTAGKTLLEGAFRMGRTPPPPDDHH